jgi:sugar phosphate isomerase/epimerase
MPRLIPRSLLTAATLVVASVGCRSAAPAAAAPDAPSSAGDARQIRYQGNFRAPLGVQLWSFREQAKPDPAAMLQMVRRMGFTHVETAGLYGMPAAQLADAMRQAGLRVTSMHVGYDELKNDPQTVIANAKALGARYVGIAWYPHQGAFTEADARRAVADFNGFGRTLKDAGLTFFYHNHGYEPVPHGDGTLLDLIIRETDPALVAFEMDVLWTWLPNVDPVALIRKYPGRFKLMHIKDMKPGVPRGSLAGGIPDSLKAVIGQGQVDWGAVMAAAERDGFAHYYIEDETPDPVRNAPLSISYLETLRYPARTSGR